MYFAIFLIVLVLTLFAQNSYNKHKKLSYFISFLCVLILSVFAGIRDYSVGTDINVYGLRYFEKVSTFSSLKECLNFFGTEQLYFALNYVVYILKGDMHIFLFIHQFILASIIYIIAYREKNVGTMWVYVFIYLMVWFNTSLNIIRQSLAIFVILYAFKYIEEKKYIKYIIAILIASLFHNTALVCLSIPLLIYIAKSKNKKIYIALICVSIFAIYFNFEMMVRFTSNIISNFSKYINYFEDERFTVVNFNLLFACGKAIILAVTLFFSRKLENKTGNNLLIIMLVLDLILYCSSAFVKYGYRVSYLFLVYYIYIIPRIDRSLKGSKDRNIYRLVIVIAFVMYWILRYVICKYDGTLPYIPYWYVE